MTITNVWRCGWKVKVQCYISSTFSLRASVYPRERERVRVREDGGRENTGGEREARERQRPLEKEPTANRSGNSLFRHCGGK